MCWYLYFLASFNQAFHNKSGTKQRGWAARLQRDDANIPHCFPNTALTVLSNRRSAGGHFWYLSGLDGHRGTGHAASTLWGEDVESDKFKKHTQKIKTLFTFSHQRFFGDITVFVAAFLQKPRKRLACWQRLLSLSPRLTFVHPHLLFPASRRRFLSLPVVFPLWCCLFFLAPVTETHSCVSVFFYFFSFFTSPCTSTSPWASLSSTSPLIDFFRIMKNEHGFQMAHLAQVLSVPVTLSSTY